MGESALPPAMALRKPKDEVNLNLDLTAYRKKRVQPDRRRRRTSMFSAYTFKGRRAEIRRDEETEGGYYLDQYGFRDWARPAAALLLCAVDLVANLTLRARGGADPSVLTAWASSRSGFLLAVVQLVPVAAACFLLLLNARFRWARTAGTALILGFAALAALHGMLAWEAGLDAAPPAVVRAE